MISKIENLDGKGDFEYNFWYIFIIDTLLGNVDRHLGNWGLIKSKGPYRLNLVYDCGSCLHPLIGEDYMKELLKTKELKRVAVNLETAYKKENKTLHYLDIYLNMPPLLGKSLKDIHPLINMNKIKKIIYGLDISLPMKKFYYMTILIRKEELIDRYYNMLN